MSDTMKALVYTGVETLTYQDVEKPTAGAGQTLVKIMASGICGSDMHAYLGHDDRRPAPLTLGHEAAGITADGRRVTINPLVNCGTCDACKRGQTNICRAREIISMPPRQGAFAEYVAMPDANLVEVPDDTPLEHAALAEPIACGWHAVRLTMETEDTTDVSAVVIGGGAIGVGTALCLKAFGVRDVAIVEPNQMRRDHLASLNGITVHGLDDAPAKDAHQIVVDAVGFAATRAAACEYVRPGGTIAHIGLGEAEGGLDIRRMTLQEIRFLPTYTYTAADFRDTAAAIFDGRLGNFEWTQSRPLSEGWQAFKDIRAGIVPAAKIILTPAHEE
jgi:L-gulonate 5-dehydrogenase